MSLFVEQGAGFMEGNSSGSHASRIGGMALPRVSWKMLWMKASSTCSCRPWWAEGRPLFAICWISRSSATHCSHDCDPAKGCPEAPLTNIPEPPPPCAMTNPCHN